MLFLRSRDSMNALLGFLPRQAMQPTYVAVQLRTGGVFPLKVVQRYVVEAPYMNSKQLATACSGLAQWPLTGDLVARSMKVSRDALVDCIRHKEITTQEVRPLHGPETTS